MMVIKQVFKIVGTKVSLLFIYGVIDTSVLLAKIYSNQGGRAHDTFYLNSEVTLTILV